MGIAVYCGKDNALPHRLRAAIEQRCRNQVIELYVGIRRLSQRLRTRLYEVDARALPAASERDLDGLLSLKHILSCLSIILILPNMDRSPVVKTHRLRPRFMNHVKNGFSDAAIVPAKMPGREDRLRRVEGIN